MTPILLHVLSQRPKLTGSGTTLDAFASNATKRGWNQHAVVGIPQGAPFDVDGLSADQVSPLVFEQGDVDFPVPGMSDVMPYQSTRFSSMSESQLEEYRNAWKSHLKEVVSKVRPDVILSHHIWIMSSLLKDVAPSIPIVTQCHSTGLRQMMLCPHIADDVINGCARNDRFIVLRKNHATQLCKSLGVEPGLVQVVGAGYNDTLFHPNGRVESSTSRLVYVGKLSAAKGLPWLLDAVEALVSRGWEIELNVAGAGAGDEATALKDRFRKMDGVVKYHGQLDQPALGALMRTCNVCVLPSFYEGVPLVLAEAFACGCRLVSTALPGVVDELCPHLGDAILLVPLPRLIGVDTPDPADLPEFTSNLSVAIEKSMTSPPLDIENSKLAKCCQHFTWSAVFGRVEAVLLDVLKSR